MNKQELIDEFKNNLTSALSELFDELNNLNAEWERCDQDQSIEDNKFTANKSFNIKLSAIGNPQISKAEIDSINGFFYLDILVPGIEDGTINITQYDDKLDIVLDEQYESQFTKAFELSVKSDDLSFMDLKVEKRNGLLYIVIPITNKSKSL